jgi:hypothetical protein
MRRSLALAAAAATFGLAGVSAGQSITVADYSSDFSYPAASAGWTYRWNANGPIGTAANYVSLLPDIAGSGRYEAVDNDAYPDPAPAGSTAATSTTLTPGRGTGPGQDGNTTKRFVIAGYTILPQDLVDLGLTGDSSAFLTLSSYAFDVSALSADGITAQMYKNDQLFLSQGLPPGTLFTSETPGPNSGPIPLGPFSAGDTFYVAIGSDPSNPITGDPLSGNDINDVINLDYTLTLSVPEPSAIAAAGIGLAAVAARRRRR